VAAVAISMVSVEGSNELVSDRQVQLMGWNFTGKMVEVPDGAEAEAGLLMKILLVDVFCHTLMADLALKWMRYNLFGSVNTISVENIFYIYCITFYNNKNCRVHILVGFIQGFNR